MEPLGTCPHRFFFPSVPPSNNFCLETEAANHDCMLKDAACKTENKHIDGLQISKGTCSSQFFKQGSLLWPQNTQSYRAGSAEC
jgi:hypothetical protein